MLGGSYLQEHRAGASVTFGFRGGAVTLYTVAGPSMGWGRIAIDGVGRGTFDGYAPSFRTGVAHTFAGLGSGRHTLTVTALGTKVHAAAGSQVGVDAIRWAGSLRRSPTPAGGAWGSVSSASAAGGAYVASDVAGASAQLHFRGTGATWITVAGPAMGRAQIWVDGRLVRTVGLFARHLRYGVPVTVSGLTDRPHGMRIVVLGTHAAASSGNAVAVDGWIVR